MTIEFFWNDLLLGEEIISDTQMPLVQSNFCVTVSYYGSFQMSLRDCQIFLDLPALHY